MESCTLAMTNAQLEASRPTQYQGAKVALIWLDRFPEQQYSGLYLVNGSNEVLTWVKAESICTITVEDEGYGSGGDMHCYNNVEPGQAVKLDEYDGFYDLDCMLTIAVSFYSSSLGVQKIIPPQRKGGLKRRGLIWQSADVSLFPYSAETISDEKI